MRDLDIKARRRGPAPSTHGRCSSTTNGFEWSSELAYAVGLIATDGCLGRDKSHMTMTSKDIDLLETFKRCLGIKTGRLSRTSTVTTPSRRLGTSTRESICRLFRRVRHSSTGYAGLSNDSLVLPVTLIFVDPTSTTTSGVCGMRSERLSCCFVGCTTTETSHVSGASVRSRHLF